MTHRHYTVAILVLFTSIGTSNCFARIPPQDFSSVRTSIGATKTEDGTTDPSSFVPDFPLSALACSALSKGKAWFEKKRGWVIQDIQAPSTAVWEQILDFARYEEKVPDTIESQVYQQEESSDGSQTIFTRFQAGNKIMKLNFFVKARHEPFNNRLIWTLDSSQPNDIVASIGCWYVLPIDAHSSRVYYKQVLSLFPRMPAFLKSAISGRSAAGATAWVKKHSEEMLMANH